MSDGANFGFLAAVFTMIICHSANSTPLNNRPIIGVLTQETYGDFKEKGDTFILSSYIKDLEGGGARVVPIRIFQSTAYYIDIFKRINGVFFPGGGVDLFTSGYSMAGKILFELALKANAAGDYFPVWGTCLGFELLSVLVANKDVMESFDAKNLPLPLDLIYPDFVHSKLYGNASEKIIQSLLTENVTANYHDRGLSPEVYYNDKALTSFFHILSTNLDRNGKAFVSSFEGRKYPFFGVQFHPEKNTFIWATKYKWLHTEDAVKVTQYFAEFLVDQGILTQDNWRNDKLNPYGESYVQAAYVKFLQSGGARVVPIKVQQPETYYYEMFNHINGLFLPGGRANTSSSAYANIAKLFITLAIQANLAGDYFPIWGTCLGLQHMLVMVSSRKRLFSQVKAYNLPVKLDLYPDYRTSMIFREARPHIIETLRKKKVSNLNHKYGILFKVFIADENLMKFFRIISTSTDRLGQRIVTGIEAWEFPFWGIQFHPEKTAFVWEEKFRFIQTREAVEVSQFFGNFFVDQARRNNHSFPNRQMELLTVIQNYHPAYPKIFYPFEEVYMFNISTNVIDLL